MRNIGSSCALWTWSSAISVNVTSILLFAAVLADWFVVHMAVLGPIIACLCYGSSFSQILGKSVRNITGICIGGFFCKLWLLIIRLCSEGVTGSQDYNQYAAVAISAPWILGFYLFLPRNLGSLSATTLIFMTLVIYCGDDAHPDAFPLRAILAGSVGGLVPIVVALLTYSINAKTRSDSIVESRLIAKLWAIWDQLLDQLMLPDSRAVFHDPPVAYLESLSGAERARLTKCIAILQALRSLLTVKDSYGLDEKTGSSVPGTILSYLLQLKSDRIRSQQPIDLDISRKLSVAVCDELDCQHSTDIMRIVAASELAPKFLNLMNEIRETADPWTAETPTLKSSIRSAFPAEISLPTLNLDSLLSASRFCCVMIGLGEILVFWDATDVSVDTYALWAFVPALLFSERIQFMGQAILDGARYLLASLLGGGIGLLCLLLGEAGRTSLLTGFMLMQVIGFYVQASRPKWGDAGIIFIIAWIVCVLGNLGLDPENANQSDGSGLNILWRIALYRTAITCFSVFLMALSFLIVPARSAKVACTSTRLELDQHWIQCIEIAQENRGSKKEEKLDESSPMNKYLIEYVDLYTWAGYEIFQTQSRLSDPSQIKRICLSLMSFLSLSELVERNEGLHRPESIQVVESSMTALVDALRYGEFLASKTRELKESIVRARKWISTNDSVPVSKNDVLILCSGQALIETAKNFIIESLAPEATDII
jgi:hypothetical protein